jgi:hypothetical protein
MDSDAKSLPVEALPSGLGIFNTHSQVLQEALYKGLLLVLSLVGRRYTL